jgi:plasmid stabilization system protein ParE
VLAIRLGWNDGGFVGFFERADDNIETLLPNSSEMGRSGRIPGTRELAIPKTPFIVPYRLVGNAIRVLRIFTPRALARDFLRRHVLPMHATVS